MKKCGKLLENGADVNLVVSNLTPYGIIENYDILNKYRARIDIGQVVNRMEYGDLVWANRLEKIIACGMDADKLSKMLEPHDLVKFLDLLIKHGANINVHRLVRKLDYGTILDNLSVLNDHGAKINEARLRRKMH